MGTGAFAWFIGVVEDTADPLTIGRVKVRCFGYHPQDREAVPTNDLPWSITVQPNTSASNSGIGFSPNGLVNGSWVIGFFADGQTAQYPIVLGSLPGLHRPSGPNDLYGNDGSGYHNQSDIGSGAPSDGPYATDLGQGPGTGAVIKDDGATITMQSAANWKKRLKYYDPTKIENDNNGLRASDGSLLMHASTVLALEELTSQWTGKAFKLRSAYRSPRTNRGAKRSQHMKGRAFDIYCSSIGGSDPGNIKKFIHKAVECGFVGFGWYGGSNIHIDTGSGRMWGPTYSKGSAPAWFIRAVESAPGWHYGKRGLQNVKTKAGAEVANTPSNSTSTETDKGDNTKVPGEEAVKKSPVIDTTERGPLTNHKVARTIEDKMRAAGYNDYAIAAMKVGADNESSFNPNAFNPRGGGDGAYGIFQWRGPRQDALGAYRDQKRIPVDKQVDFMLKEIGPGGTHSRIGRQLKAARSPREAQRAASDYEAYGGYKGGAEYESRVRQTEKLMGGDLGKEVGFKDPTTSYPLPNYKGKPSTHETARGMNANPLDRYDGLIASKLGGYPTAGDTGLYGQAPEIGAQNYATSSTWASKPLGQQVIELSGAADAEKVAIRDLKWGNTIEMTPGGHTLSTPGDTGIFSAGDGYLGMSGQLHMTGVKGVGIRSTSDATIHADGNMILISGNDLEERVHGKRDLATGEVLQIKAKKIIIQADGIDFYSTSDIKMRAEGGIHMKAKSFNASMDDGIDMTAGKGVKATAGEGMDLKAGSTMKATAGSTMNIKGSTTHIDDIITMAEGKAADAQAATAANPAASTDIGIPGESGGPGRSIVADNTASATPPNRRGISKQDTLDHYTS